jgi:hypothetical protein
MFSQSCSKKTVIKGLVESERRQECDKEMESKMVFFRWSEDAGFLHSK